ncbi:MAG: ATP-binding protein [Deltaproteobacteria bacterium]|jgi:hypothetical protein|nr:ATP-binding protein [Deltaproteobacteria bacterium]
MKKLPIGISSFKDVIEGGYVYADKTEFIYNIVNTGKPYFLSRPRRFGKSLLLSTFEALFSGPPDPDGPPQGLFKDLWIGQSDYDFTQKYPIVTLTMTEESTSPAELRADIIDTLQEISDLYQLDVKITTPGKGLTRIIKELYKKNDSKPVVVLVDEYDAPVSDVIENPELARENSQILKNFYSGFKNADHYLRFVFVTGVTRYAFMGLSSGLNHLIDLTLNKKFSGICGFTIKEFDSCFREHLPAVLERIKIKGILSKRTSLTSLRKKILSWYDGYTWDGQTKILNPWSILSFFNTAEFSDYWVQTNPSVFFMAKLFKKDPFALIKDSYNDFSAKALGQAKIGELTPIAGLFQTGYLTVDKTAYDHDSQELYSLKIPNLEIIKNRDSFFSDEMFKMLGLEPEKAKDAFEIAASGLDAEKLTEIFNSIFKLLPAEHHHDSESCYHKVVFGYCWKFGRVVIPEAKQAIGNSDLVVIFPMTGLYVIIELKFDRGEDSKDLDRLTAKLAEKALKSIKSKEYCEPYKAQAKQLVKIGLGVTHRRKCRALIEG